MIGVTGYLCLDVFPTFSDEPVNFIPGMLFEVGPLRCTAGGSVGNTGGALARLGVPVRLGGVTGDDFIGETLRNLPLWSKGKAESAIRMVAGGHTAYSIVLNPPNIDRMFFCHRGVNDLLTADSYGPDFRKGLSILHFGYPPICEAMALQDGAELKKLYRACREEGILTSMDMSLPSPGTRSYQLDWTAFLANVLPETDLFCPSIDELRFMLKSPEASVAECLERLEKLGARAVFLKLGKEGLYLHTTDDPETERVFARFGTGNWRGIDFHVPPRPVKVINATGAGDTAIAGLLEAIHNGKSGTEAAEYAARLAEDFISTTQGVLHS